MAAEPYGQNEPGSHGIHSSEPGLSWYVPPSHASHFEAPLLFENVPALQAVGSVLPVEQKLPGGQMVHSSSSARSVRLE